MDLGIVCGCELTQNISIIEFENEYNKKYHNENRDIKNEIGSLTLTCKYHQQEKIKKFFYYCIDCGFDLCGKCIKNDSPTYSNTIIMNTQHENHTKIKLDEICSKFENIENLKKKSKEIIIIMKKNYDDNNKRKLNLIFDLIDKVITVYQTYQCYNLYRCIESGLKFLEKFCEDNFEIDSHKELDNSILITIEKDLNDNIRNISTKIKKIEIKYSTNIDFDIKYLKYLKDINFPILKELILVGNKIKDISPLLTEKCKFVNLEKLDLAYNQIDDKSIIQLLNKNLPELNHLNIYKNNLTNLEIFEIVRKFKKLKLFYVGENKFIIDKIKDFHPLPETLEEFGFTGNINGVTNYMMVRLGIKNLKILYISRNKLTNLNCMKKIEFENLEEFWAISNGITDIKEIMKINKKGNLLKINLKQNKINNFSELIDIIKYFPKLQQIGLVDNYIKEEEAEDIQKIIKEKYNMDLKIVVKEKEGDKS